MNQKYNPALFWFATTTAVTTFLLIGFGGLVTSHEAGMSVPDWPNSYGYNMFLFPIKDWVGGIFYEHTHRLLATVVGLLTTILAIWLYGKDAKPFLRWGGLCVLAFGIYLLAAKSETKTALLLAKATCAGGIIAFCASFFWPRCEQSARWLCWLGITAFLLVIVQGVIGGLRVRLNMDYLGIPHGAIAQTFLVLTAAIALFTSRWWQNTETEKPKTVPRGLRRHVLYVAILIFIQLIIGATMRHQHAGLSIWDFPLAHGQLWPSTTPAAIANYNAHRPPGTVGHPVTAFEVNLQMVHRIVALLIFLGVAAAAFLARKKLGGTDGLTKFAWFWFGLLALQIILGAATVLSNKAADVTTLHVMVGAVALLAGALWWLAAARRTRQAEKLK